MLASSEYITLAGTPASHFDILICIAPGMTRTSIPTTASLGPAEKMSGYQSDEPRLQLPQSILPTVLTGGWYLSTWQYIVLFLIGIVVFDQGIKRRSSRKSVFDHMI
jgi:hypothetical protein